MLALISIPLTTLHSNVDLAEKDMDMQLQNDFGNSIKIGIMGVKCNIGR